MNSSIRNSSKSFIVSDNNKRLSELVTQIKKQLVQVFLVTGVKGTGRLVSQDHRWVVDQRTGYGNTLFLSTRQFIGFM